MRKPALTRSRNKDTPVSRKTQLDFLVGGLWLTVSSRVDKGSFTPSLSQNRTW